MMYGYQGNEDMLTIQLPKDMETRLNALAESTKRPESFYVREALERTLGDIEAAYLTDEQFGISGGEAMPLEKTAKKRIGILSGKLHIPDDFDAPLPDDVLRSFDGGDD